MNLEAIEADSIVNAVVVESQRITPPDTEEVRRLVLRVDEPAFRAKPGQNIGVVVSGDSAFGGVPHVRRYSITDVAPIEDDDGVDIGMLVRRCFYIDEVNGERYPGIASNFLCDAGRGQAVALVGPYKNPFQLPADNTANLLLIGAGTGIAPFRIMIQQAYRGHMQWKGDVRLFYGARSGMESLYTNQQGSDLAQYYDQETFEAFNALALRPLSDERDALAESLSAHIDTAWELLNQPNTHVYLAGLRKVADITDKIFSERAAHAGEWKALKERLTEEGRWSELVYG